MPKEALTETVLIRATPEDVARIAALAERLGLTRAHVARAALRAGLEAVETNPLEIFPRVP